MLKDVDAIVSDLQGIIGGYELKYNKFYIGMAKDGVPKNFLMLKPKKNFLYLIFKGYDDSDLMQQAEDEGLDLSFKPRFREYYLRKKDYSEYKKHKDFIDSCISSSMEYFNISES